MIKDLDPDFWYCYINSCHDRFLPDHGIFDIIEDKEWEEKAPKEIQELERRQPEEGEYSFEISAVKADGRYGMIINVILDSGLDCTKDIPGEIKRSLSRKTAEVISRETGCDVYDEHEPLQEYAIFVPADKWAHLQEKLGWLEDRVYAYYDMYEDYVNKFLSGQAATEKMGA